MAWERELSKRIPFNRIQRERLFNDPVNHSCTVSFLVNLLALKAKVFFKSGLSGLLKLENLHQVDHNPSNHHLTPPLHHRTTAHTHTHPTRS